MITSENPYQSPQSSEPAEVRPEDRRGLGPWVMIPVGFMTGCVMIGISGALGAALLFIIGSGRMIDVVFVVGGVFGAVGGGLIGAIAGLRASLAPVRSRRQFIWSVAILSAIYGGAVGTLGGLAVRFNSSNWMLVGALIGGAAGLAGGFLLGQLLAMVCWDQAKAEGEVGDT